MAKPKDKDMHNRILYDLVFEEKREGTHLIVPQKEVIRILSMIKEEPIYRIRVNDDTTVDIDCYDLLENFAPELEKSYDSVQDLPEWAQSKLAVLMVLDVTKRNEEIRGVGKRINNNIFWVFRGEDDGVNAGIES
jgi:hypothetical protein